MKIYIVAYNSYDGECSYDVTIKAFTKKEKAEEHVILCTNECIRIQSEADAHYLKNKEEMDILSQKIRDLVLTKGKWLGANRHPESIRRLEIFNEEREIMRSHKYHPDFISLTKDYEYNIQELELTDEM
jgi:hypothetical protein